ncbi:helix-turn-helix domain-containing protein [Rhizobium rhizogenes]|uniref:helix-turn-helix domain-containing protein n=1 Tax=Rhizobium rhizogenes TaxID=359 RepID=UPI0015726D7D|nr:helix-turn-helix transcriptional regulator [Rhizobium rhizogenes]NTF80526.1 helix-turn-helix transcriptional regulator [Rhizobium rhizogenes]
MSITVGQCRAARGLIGWSQGQLSESSKVSTATIANFESGKRTPIANNLSAIRSALEAAGIAFLDGAYSGSGGPGVRLASSAGSPIDTDESETIQYPEFLEGDGGPGSGG